MKKVHWFRRPCKDTNMVVAQFGSTAALPAILLKTWASTFRLERPKCFYVLLTAQRVAASARLPSPEHFSSSE